MSQDPALKTPAHVAIIMDGNGRWASLRGKPRTYGHYHGAKAVRRSIEAANTLGVRYLTLYGFSTENWKRPEAEVTELMGLLRRYLRSELAEIHKHNVRIRIIGNRWDLPSDIVTLIHHCEEVTAENTGLTLIVALSYGGRQEITQAVQEIAKRAQNGKLDPGSISEEVIQAYMQTAGIPDPDIIIRTSGEQRLSNFLIWQAAYTEFVFLECHWPDFDQEQFEKALMIYTKRERRYGGL